MWNKNGPVWVIIILFATALYMAFFTVDQTERAILLQLGAPVREPLGPGLHIKIPILQKVVIFETYTLDDDPPPVDMITADKKTLTVDGYARWAIVEPLKFYTAARDKERARDMLRDVILGELRVEIGRSLMTEVVSTRRSAIMDEVTKRSAVAVKELGISVVDVRIKRIQLPVENERAVYDRMISERDRLARITLAQGREEARKIRAEAEKASAALLAEAYRKAEETKGEGDAEAARIYAAGYGQAPEFFNFVRTLDLYRRTLDERSTLFLSRDDEFMGLMKGDRP